MLHYAAFRRLDDRSTLIWIYAMADTQDYTQPSFSTENDHVDNYRQLSRLAVCSIPLGLLSALSLISPLLWFVPMIAVVFALGGLWHVSRSKDVTGRNLALFGLGLAILFGTWGMTWTLSRRIVINQQAKKHASEWLVLMQNEEYMKAHQLGISFFERVPSGMSLEEKYQKSTIPDEDEYSEDDYDIDDVGQDDYDEDLPDMISKTQSLFMEFKDFKEHGISGILIDAKGDFEFAFVRNKILHRKDEFDTRVDQVFRLRFSAGHEPQEMDINIELKRTVEDHKAYWQIGMTTDENESR
jgi:hypothetical protein